ncbi:hypothetical protein XENOCAPTIV_019607, partial [Xenoophorus captivus]
CMHVDEALIVNLSVARNAGVYLRLCCCSALFEERKVSCLSTTSFVILGTIDNLCPSHVIPRFSAASLCIFCLADCLRKRINMGLVLTCQWGWYMIQPLSLILLFEMFPQPLIDYVQCTISPL